MQFLDSNRKHPMVMPDGTIIKQVVHLKKVIDHPRITAGDYSYYHNFEELDDYAGFMAPYLFPISPDQLIIGKFVQIAHGVRFITGSANHDMKAFTTYPFFNFMMTPETNGEDFTTMFEKMGHKGDTVVGNDVWIGMDAMILPGVTIGDGAIIGARAVVSRDVAPYTMVGGNPAKVIKKRFSDEMIATLLEIGWWNWPINKIEANLEIIQGADIDALKALA